MIRNREDLERKCRDVLRPAREQGEDDTPAPFVEREMALTLDHIRRLRRRERHIRHRLLERECDLETQILRVLPEAHRYSADRWAAGSKMVIRLTSALASVEDQRRRIAVDADKRMQALRDRLLQLLNMHSQLRQYDGDPEVPA